MNIAFCSISGRSETIVIHTSLLFLRNNKNWLFSGTRRTTFQNIDGYFRDTQFHNGKIEAHVTLIRAKFDGIDLLIWPRKICVFLFGLNMDPYPQKQVLPFIAIEDDSKPDLQDLKLLSKSLLILSPCNRLQCAHTFISSGPERVVLRPAPAGLWYLWVLALKITM